MPKFIVEVKCSTVVEVEVEASDEFAAQDLAVDKAMELALDGQEFDYLAEDADLIYRVKED